MIKALKLSNTLAVNKNKFKQPYFLLFSVIEKDELSEERIGEFDNETRISITTQCFRAINYKEVGSHFKKKNLLSAKKLQKYLKLH